MIDQFVDNKELFTKLTLEAIDRVLSLAKKGVREYWTQHKGRDADTYSDYLSRKGKQLSLIRNIIYTNKNVFLYQIYVPTYILPRDRTVDEYIESFCKSVADPDRRQTRSWGISGAAGSGKTLLMRHAFFQIQKINSGRIPIFLEMRSFNRMSKSNIETKILEDFAALGIKKFDSEQILAGLSAGLFAFLFDGIDEIKTAIQDYYMNEIDSFIHRYPLCPVLLSGRPSLKFSSLPLEETSRMARMSIAETSELVSKLEYDTKIKNEFLVLLQKKLYKTHSDYISNPLLCTIMLLTFSCSGRISDSRHEFYQDAFLTLWERHDIRQAGIAREKLSKLDKRDFERLTSAFAMSSYLRGDYELRDADIRKHFMQAKKLCGVNCTEEAFVKDLTISTCLAVEDGPVIRFIHRSFQEYFAAIFLCDAPDNAAGVIIEQLSDRIETDKVITLALSRDSEKIERNWVLEKVTRILSLLDKTSNDLKLYIDAAFGTDPSYASIRKDLNKIRTLYEFDPDFETLLAAYDATQHMGKSIMKLKKGSRHVTIFERDRKNFLNLSKLLTQKYQTQTSALQIFLQNDSRKLITNDPTDF